MICNPSVLFTTAIPNTVHNTYLFFCVITVILIFNFQMKSHLDWLMNQLMVQLLAIYYLTEEFLICLPQNKEKNISCCNFFALTSVLGDFCKHWDTTTVTQLSGGQATTGSSLAVGPSFQMETATAPGISHDSIMHYQDWGRLLCQSNVVDPHHEHPPAYAASFLPVQCVCEQVCVGSWILFLNSLPFME